MSALRKIDYSTQERRWNSRVSLVVEGRLILEDGREFPCRTVDVSLGGLRIATPAKAGLGDRILMYFDNIGRLEGKVVRVAANGLAIRLILPNAKRKRLTEMLMWHANRGAIGAEEDRRHQRVVPHANRTVIELLDRSTFAARLINVSVSGASLEVTERPPIGARVVVGRTTGTVVRHFDNGIAVEFLRLIPREALNENLVL